MENDINHIEDINNNPKSPIKRYLYLILAIIIIAGVVWGLNSFKKDTVTNTAPETKKEVNLTDQQKQDYEKEVTDLENQIKNLPTDASASDKYKVYSKLAAAKYYLGLYKEALATLDFIKDENKDRPALWQRYSMIYRDMGDLEKARENAKKAVDLDKSDPAYWISYLEVSANQGANTLKDIYNDALKNTENNVNVIIAYAQLLEKIGDKQGAIEQWKKAGEVDAKNKAQYDAEITRLQS